ncbi:hypothetical protein [Roseovarius atlanticus]|uniref:hypothetical protein n=1 Tax=Roseovarius atlanticus TaxID=1641875 RepID=UPI000B31E3CA|nr:hypothetical protein [Roseovarius atlanticus]
MPVLNGPGSSLEESHYLGVAIKNAGGDQNHCGLLYRLDDGEVRMLHLAFHFDLRDDEWRPDYCCAPVGFELENQLVVAAFANAVANAEPNVPYGFDANGMVFDRSSGELLEAPAGKGLTCATFVLALLRTLGFEPLDEASWPVRDDDEEWQAKILELMKANDANEDHIEAVTRNGQSKRFRPEEVVGASITDSDEWSIEFDKAQEIAQKVLEDIAA